MDRKNVMVRKTKTTLKNNPSTGLVCRGGLGGGGSCPLKFRCAQLLILEAERVLNWFPKFLRFLLLAYI